MHKVPSFLSNCIIYMFFRRRCLSTNFVRSGLTICWGAQQLGGRARAAGGGPQEVPGRVEGVDDVGSAGGADGEHGRGAIGVRARPRALPSQRPSLDGGGGVGGAGRQHWARAGDVGAGAAEEPGK
jgi:hypothetical protein